MKIALETLGCKLNQAETESLMWELSARGWEVVNDVREADVYVLNTCTVTATADAKARHRLKLAHQRNPQALIVAAGCYAQRDPERLAAFDGVGLVVSNEDKPGLAAMLADRLRLSSDVPSCMSGSLPSSLRTRAFVKVQDGCDGRCAYCIVPKVRSQQKSVPAAQVLAEVRARLEHGFKEIVITGTEVGSYSDGGFGLEELLQMVLTETEVPRLRLSSLQPQEISRSLLSLWQDERMCPHFHLSLQSGSIDVLRAMRRGYSIERYAEAVSMIRRMVPAVALTTDIIVGFPGETDAMFEESFEVCRNLEFARIHVFPFSARPTTEAASLVGKVDDATKRSRTDRMLALAAESAQRFREASRGKVRPVLWERRDSSGTWTGFTDNYIAVSCRSTEDLQNRIMPFRVE